MDIEGLEKAEKGQGLALKLLRILNSFDSLTILYP